MIMTSYNQIFFFICLYTENIKRLSNFYQLVLQTTADCDDEMHQEILTDGASLAILKRENADISGNRNMSMAFTVPDVDVEFYRLQGAGIKIMEPPTTRFWGARNMMFLDPDENHVVFRSFPQNQ